MATTRTDADPGLDVESQREMFARTVIAGHPQGAVRRIVLYTLAFALCVSPVPALCVIPLALLVATDSIL